MNHKLHLSLNVRDVERSTAFYEAFFGQAPHKRRPGYANFDLTMPALKLALTEQEFSQSGSLNHLGILVPSTAEVQAARERLAASGLVTFDEENVTCCYARADKVWVRDPDGNAWEIYTILDDMTAEFEAPPENHACCTPTPAAATCCAEKETSAVCCP
jgi:catechol 2,3-dioxygenase-like lactoylglutathione lyase family enzyme